MAGTELWAGVDGAFTGVEAELEPAAEDEDAALGLFNYQFPSIKWVYTGIEILYLISCIPQIPFLQFCSRQRFCHLARFYLSPKIILFHGTSFIWEGGKLLPE